MSNYFILTSFISHFARMDAVNVNGETVASSEKLERLYSDTGYSGPN